MGLEEYRRFIASRGGTVQKHGITPGSVNPKAKVQEAERSAGDLFGVAA